MDSISQAVLGASVAGACAPRGQRRQALLAGALLGTLPDLDVLIDYGDAVRNFTYHRGFSHSLLVLAPFSVLLWSLLRVIWSPVRESPGRWLLAISLTLLTHPLLDAFTAYGTQLLWPLDVPPTMWATLFIIDPLYTLPLLVGTIAASVWPQREWSNSALRSGLAASTVYVAWSLFAQAVVKHNATNSLADLGLRNAAVFVTPTPLNTLLWRVVVMTEDGYLEGFDSLMLNESRLQFRAYQSDVAAQQNSEHLTSVTRLNWFAQGFTKMYVQGDRLIVSDLRMGQEPSYVFSHVVAERGNPHWNAIDTELLPVTFGERAIKSTWRRIWSNLEN